MNTDASAENNNQKPDRKFPSTLILLIIGAILLIATIILYPEARSRMEEQSSANLLELSLTPEAESIEVTNPDGRKILGVGFAPVSNVCEATFVRWIWEYVS